MMPAKPATVEHLIEMLFAGAWENAPHDRMFGRIRLSGHPDEAAEILADPETFAKEYNFLTELGRSRFDADGEDWAQRRDLTQPLLREAARSVHHPKIAQTYANRFNALDEGPVGETLERAMLAGACDVLIAAFGGSLSGELLTDWLFRLRPVARKIQHYAMFGSSPQMQADVRAQMENLRRDITQTLEGDPVLAAWAKPDIQGCPAHSIADFDGLSELILAILAGTETTASAFSWSVICIGSNLEMQDRIVRDIHEKGVAAPSLEVMLQEAMRSVPPVPILVKRVAKHGATLGGKPVAFGALIGLDFIRLHHDRAYWENPRKFIPDRAEFANRTYNRRAYLPFSAGARVCGGLGLARAELHNALAELLKRFRIKLPPGQNLVEMEYALTLRPRNLHNVILERRHG